MGPHFNYRNNYFWDHWDGDFFDFINLKKVFISR